MISCTQETCSRCGPDSAVGASQIVVELQELQRRMVRDLERFLSFGLSNPRKAWPRQDKSGRAPASGEHQKSPASQLS